MSKTLPSGWSYQPIENLASGSKNAVVDGPFGSNLKTEDYVGEGVPVLQGGNITGNRFQMNGLRFISHAKAKELERSAVFPGDALLIKIGSIGYSAIIQTLGEYPFAIIPANMMKITFDETKASVKFVHHYFQSESGQRQFKLLAQSQAQPALSLGAIKKYSIPTPPLPEQTKIAEILSTVDQVIDLTVKEISRLEDLKKGMMKDLFTKGIGHTKFKDSPIGKIPEGWVLDSIGNRCKGVVPGRNKPKVFDGHIPWVTTPDILDLLISKSKLGLAISEREAKNTGNVILPPRSVVMSCVGEFGIVGITTLPTVINQQLHGYICPTNVSPEYIAYYLQYSKKRLENLATQTTIAYLNKTSCNGFNIPFPSFNEQKEISSILSSFTNSIRSKNTLVNQIKKLKNGLMNDLLTGKVRVKV